MLYNFGANATEQGGNVTTEPTNINTITPLQKIILYNLLGNKVYEQVYNSSIDISFLATG